MKIHQELQEVRLDLGIVPIMALNEIKSKTCFCLKTFLAGDIRRVAFHAEISEIQAIHSCLYCLIDRLESEK